MSRPSTLPVRMIGHRQITMVTLHLTAAKYHDALTQLVFQLVAFSIQRLRSAPGISKQQHTFKPPRDRRTTLNRAGQAGQLSLHNRPISFSTDGCASNCKMLHLSRPTTHESLSPTWPLRARCVPDAVYPFRAPKPVTAFKNAANAGSDTASRGNTPIDNITGAIPWVTKDRTQAQPSKPIRGPLLRTLTESPVLFIQTAPRTLARACPCRSLL